MRFIFEDESEGDASRGYITIVVVDDAGEVIVDADLSNDLMPDSAAEFASLFRTLGRIEEAVGL